MDAFKLKVVTPERVFFEDDVEMVEFNTTEGEIGIYKNHVPTTVIIKPGVLNIYMADSEKTVKKAALHEGFVEILGDRVTILAEVIEWPDEIDEERAEKSKERAEKRLSEKETGTDVDRATASLLRAMARINVIR
ncbi:MAG: ATP synthase F1 subunit epsilon [Lachnospiraceae bacterium]|nr:ATP synthase F1 subunit epsilon [Lachnospiraceae bacterium]